MYLKTLDVLSADINNELHVGHKIFRGGKVRDGFDDTEVNIKGVFDNVLSVAGHGGGNDVELGVHGVDLLEERLDDIHGVAPGGKIFRMEQFAVLVEHYALDGGGAGVHSDVSLALVALQRLLLHVRLRVTRPEGFVFGFTCEKRAVKRKIARAAVVPDALDHLIKVDGLVRAERRAASDVVE